MNYSSEQLLKIYKTLPEELRSAITSPELDAELEKIGKEHAISTAQQTELNRQALFLLMKITPVSLFSTEIEHQLHISPEVSHEISEKVQTRVCGDVLPLLTNNPDQKNSETETVSRDQVLSEIENPIPNRPGTPPPNLPPLQQSNLIDNKLSGFTRMPKEDITVTEKGSPVAQAVVDPSTPQAAVVPPTPQPEPKPAYKGFDPYREQPK